MVIIGVLLLLGVAYLFWHSRRPPRMPPAVEPVVRKPGEVELVAPPVARERLRFTSPAFERLSVPEQEETIQRLESMARGMFRGKKL